MALRQKLELTWIGKENRPRLEPRILIEDPTKSYHAKYRVKNLTTENTESTEKKRENNIPSQFSSVSSVNSVVNPLLLEELTEKIIGCAIEVHRQLGPGLLENAYESCLFLELSLASIPVSRQVPLPLIYKGTVIDVAYRLDLVVDDQVVIELKSVDRLLPIHEAQLLTYLKLSKKKVGLLINFNVPLLTQGLKRFVL